MITMKKWEPLNTKRVLSLICVSKYPPLSFAFGPGCERTILAEKQVTHKREILFPLMVSVCGGESKQENAV